MSPDLFGTSPMTDFLIWLLFGNRCHIKPFVVPIDPSFECDDSLSGFSDNILLNILNHECTTHLPQTSLVVSLRVINPYDEYFDRREEEWATCSSCMKMD